MTILRRHEAHAILRAARELADIPGAVLVVQFTNREEVTRVFQQVGYPAIRVMRDVPGQKIGEAEREQYLSWADFAMAYDVGPVL